MPKSTKFRHKKHLVKASANKQPLIVMNGIVTKRLPDANFEVQLENGHLLKKAYVAGRMRNKYYIPIAIGDGVRVELTPYDLTKGRIVFRGVEDKTQATSA
jgi:translation initiation factor IF-1